MNVFTVTFDQFNVSLLNESCLCLAPVFSVIRRRWFYCKRWMNLLNVEHLDETLPKLPLLHAQVQTHTHTHTHTHTCFCELWGHSIGVMVFILYKPYFLSPYTNPTPKPTPYRKLCATLYLKKKKKSFCMIYKPFEIWGHGEMSS